MARARLPLAPRSLARALDAHAARLSACRACAHPAGVVPTVSKSRAPRAMLVGQAPGQTESGGGRPFAGRAGRTLFRWLEQAGLDEATAREALHFAAVTRCYPGPHPSGRGDRVPSPRERELCGGWLAEELRIIRPTVVIPVGRLAIGRFLGARSLADVVGCEHDVEHEGGRSVAIPLPHPSGASSWIHAPGNHELLDRALDLLRRRLGAENRSAHARSVA
jgi:uracil-DNA glycosylase